MNRNKWWEPIIHFLGHTIIGSVIFVGIALIAAALGIFTHALTTHLLLSPFTVKILTGLEESLLVCDAISFLVYLSVTTFVFIRDMLRTLK